MRNQILLLTLFSFWSNLIVGQELPFLLQDLDFKKPEWKEFLQISVNQKGDTLYLANGREVNPGLVQCDRYDTNSLWLGVDRFVWESNKALRIYHHHGFEEYIAWHEDGRIIERAFQDLIHKREYSFDYEGSLIKRIAINDSLGYTEYVFLYQGNSERINKVKQFLDGNLLAQIHISYNLDGNKTIEEYWYQGELKNLVTFAYNDESQLQSVLVMQHQNGRAFLQEQHSYSFADQNAQKEISHFYLENSKVEWLLRRRLVDSQKRLLKEERVYHNHETAKEIDTYSYEAEIASQAIYGLSSGK